MITNERQYKITKSQLAKLYKGIEEYSLDEVIMRTGSETLAKAELEGLKSEAAALEKQVREYETLKSGVIKNFKAKNLDELPIMLIRARIAQQLSQRELGELVGLKQQQIQRYESEKYASANLKRLREIAKALELSITEIAEITPISNQLSNSTDLITLDWDKFPSKEMYKRGWFEGFQGSIRDLASEANELVENFVKTTIKKPTLALHRKHVRMDSQYDPYALLAWECRIAFLASKVEVIQKYDPTLITDEWIDNLRRLSSSSKGPEEAKTMLRKVGIIVAVEPHLPGTYLDGAAMLLNGETPVIGLTLRYDRLDNFWFVLFHELIHITRHLRKNKLENIFDDLDEEVEVDIEKEADLLAGNALIPPSEWDKALPRFTRTKESIENFAHKLGISPSIVAGRIRRESKNYAILSDLVGQGEVRKYFPEASFGS